MDTTRLPHPPYTDTEITPDVQKVVDAIQRGAYDDIIVMFTQDQAITYDVPMYVDPNAISTPRIEHKPRKKAGKKFTQFATISPKRLPAMTSFGTAEL